MVESDAEAGSRIISNEDFVHRPEKIRKMRITLHLLECATADLGVIHRYLDSMWSGYRLIRGDSSLDKLLKGAWLYKPPPLEN
jgi:hypothetical protein